MPLVGGSNGIGDVELMRLVAAGHEGALASIYDRYSGEVFRTALRITADRATAEDVVQETFLVLWDRSGLFDPDRGSVGGWLTRIARNRAVDRLRSEGRKPRAATFSSLGPDRQDDAPAVEHLLASSDPVAAGHIAPEPETAVVAAETVAELTKALAALPEEERRPILLAYHAGLSQSEIAAHLGWPLGTVKSRSRRALQRLRQVVEESEAARTPSVEGPPAAPDMTAPVRSPATEAGSAIPRPAGRQACPPAARSGLCTAT